MKHQTSAELMFTKKKVENMDRLPTDDFPFREHLF